MAVPDLLSHSQEDCTGRWAPHPPDAMEPGTHTWVCEKCGSEVPSTPETDRAALVDLGMAIFSRFAHIPLEDVEPPRGFWIDLEEP